MNKLLQNPSHMENQYGTASNDFTVDIKQCFICAKLHSAHPGYSVTCIFPLHNPKFLIIIYTEHTDQYGTANNSDMSCNNFCQVANCYILCDFIFHLR